MTKVILICLIEVVTRGSLPWVIKKEIQGVKMAENETYYYVDFEKNIEKAGFHDVLDSKMFVKKTECVPKN